MPATSAKRAEPSGLLPMISRSSATAAAVSASVGSRQCECRWKTTELIPLLRERAAELSASRVYRLVTDKPERLSMKVLIALCDILDRTPADLIDPYAESAVRRKTAGESAAAVAELKPGLRPERARILGEE
jgi:DNA-binding Xre family transcriptional regulator